MRNIGDLGCKKYPARFNILFDYGVLKSADREFNNLIFSLTGREAFEVFNELEGAILLSVCHHSIYDFNLCIYFGLKDTLEMLFERFPFRTVDLIEISIRYRGGQPSFDYSTSSLSSESFQDVQLGVLGFFAAIMNVAARHSADDWMTVYGNLPRLMFPTLSMGQFAAF